MSKQNPAEGKHRDRKPQPEVEHPSPEMEQTADIVAASSLPFKDGSLESQAVMLQKLAPAQQQATLQRISRVQGNRHVQRLVASMRQTPAGAEDSTNVSRSPTPMPMIRPQSVRPSVVPQAKLTVSEPGDQQEIEADQVADQVMKMPASATPPPPNEDEKNNPTINRPAILNRYLRRMPVQRAEDGIGGNVVNSDVQSRIDGMQHSGRPLPDSEREFFEPRMGVDLGNVRLHTDGTAVQTSKDLNARAYTVGSHVAFNAGEYQPGTSEGRRLMAHELTHVVQQGGANKLQRKNTEKFTASFASVNQDFERSHPMESSANSRDGAIKLGASIEKRKSGNKETLKTQNQHSAQVIEQDARADVANEEDKRPDKASSQPPPQDKLKEAPVNDKQQEQTDSKEVPDDAKSEDLADETTQQTPLKDASTTADPAPDIAPPDPEMETGQIEQEAEQAKGQLENAADNASAEPLPSLEELLEPGPEGTKIAIEPAKPTPIKIDFSKGEAMSPPKPELPQIAPPTMSDMGGKLAALTSESAVSKAKAEHSPTAHKGKAPDKGVPMLMRTPLSSSAPAIPPMIQRTPNDAGHENYDPAAARSQVRSMAAGLNAAPSQVQQQIQSQAEATKTNITTSAQTLQQTVQTQVTAKITSIQAAIAQQRTALETALETAITQVDTTLETNVAAAEQKGETMKATLTDLYTTHQSNVEQAVNDYIALVETMRSDRKDEAGRLIQEKADEALSQGQAKASGYPGDERGRKQAEAVRKVAEDTAGEIEGEKTEVENSITEITEDIPSEFETQGAEALQGFDDNLPDVLQGVDDQVQTVVDGLTERAQETKEQIQQLGEQLGIQLDTMEQGVTTNLQEIMPQISTQVTSMVGAILPSVDAGAQQAIGEVVSFVGQATQTLLGIETPDVEAAQGYINQVMGFATGAPAEVTPMFQEVDMQLVEQFTQLQTLTDEQLLTTEEQTLTQSQALTDRVQTAMTELTATVSTAFEAVVTSLDEPFSEIETQVNDELTTALTDLTASFDQTLGEADGEITNAINEGLAKADEALAELDSKMNEAAEEAAWRHDHPILAGIKDIGGFVVGLVAGILVVLALVVVAIVAFQVIIAALVALGLSSAVATLIVTIAGLVLLGVGIYMAYQARVEQGQSGLMAFLGALGDIVGITDIINGIQQIREDGHVSFSSGFSIGQGLGKIGSIIFGGRINKAVKARLPSSITNPVRGSFWRRFGGGRGNAPNPRVPGTTRPGFGKNNTSDIPNGKGFPVPDEVAGAPHIDAGKQGKHVIGHPNAKPTTWRSGVSHIYETQNAWQRGAPVPGQPQARSFRPGYIVGNSGENSIKVFIGKDGLIHGVPHHRPPTTFENITNGVSNLVESLLGNLGEDKAEEAINNED